MILSGVTCHAASTTQLEQSDASGGAGSKSGVPYLELNSYMCVLGPLSPAWQWQNLERKSAVPHWPYLA